jgi:hypothetical protein
MVDRERFSVFRVDQSLATPGLSIDTSLGPFIIYKKNAC